jgi:hypothetical protein
MTEAWMMMNSSTMMPTSVPAAMAPMSCGEPELRAGEQDQHARDRARDPARVEAVRREHRVQRPGDEHDPALDRDEAEQQPEP